MRMLITQKSTLYGGCRPPPGRGSSTIYGSARSCTCSGRPPQYRGFRHYAYSTGSIQQRAVRDTRRQHQQDEQHQQHPVRCRNKHTVLSGRQSRQHRLSGNRRDSCGRTYQDSAYRNHYQRYISQIRYRTSVCRRATDELPCDSTRSRSFAGGNPE